MKSRDPGPKTKRNSELLSVLNSLPDNMQKMMRNGWEIVMAKHWCFMMLSWSYGLWIKKEIFFSGKKLTIMCLTGPKLRICNFLMEYFARLTLDIITSSCYLQYVRESSVLQHQCKHTTQRAIEWTVVLSPWLSWGIVTSSWITPWAVLMTPLTGD